MAPKRSFGSIRKLPSGRFQARYTGPDLEMHTAPETFSAKIDAEAWLAAERRLTEDPAAWRSPKQRLAEARKVRERQKARTFGVYAETWLKDRKVKGRPLSERTRDDYRKYLDRFILPTFAGVPLSDIDRDMVRRWYSDLAPAGGNPRYTGETTKKHTYDLLRAVMNTAVDDELIDVNPVRIRGAGAVDRQSETIPATLDELEALVAATPRKYQLMVMLAAWCALRSGELRELRRKDIDAKAGVVRVRRAVVFVPGETVVKPPKTRAGIRDVSIPEHLIPMVREHLLEHTQLGDDGLLFPSARGNHLRDVSVRSWYFPAREAAGRPDLRFHDLRHTGAVLAAQTGATIAELMHRLGHTTPAAAMRYQHAPAERDREIAASLSEMAIAHANRDAHGGNRGGM